MSKSATSTSKLSDEKNLICLLDLYYDEYFTPVFWQDGAKSRNYFAAITKGTKFPFQRKFLNSFPLDKQITYRLKDFPEGSIIEQKSVFIKGRKQEITFQGFFIIHHTADSIMGEEITQKETLQYFDFQERLPSIETSEENLHKLKMKIGTVIRKFARKYGDEAIVDILTSIIEEYFPNINECKK
jgi:hypothetical protein